MMHVLYISIAFAATLYLAQAFYLFVAIIIRGAELRKMLTSWGLIRVTLMIVFWPVTTVIYLIDMKRKYPRG